MQVNIFLNNISHPTNCIIQFLHPQSSSLKCLFDLQSSSTILLANSKASSINFPLNIVSYAASCKFFLLRTKTQLIHFDFCGEVGQGNFIVFILYYFAVQLLLCSPFLYYKLLKNVNAVLFILMTFIPHSLA